MSEPPGQGAARPGPGAAASPETTGLEVEPVQRCTVASRTQGEPVEATAPHAVSWVGLVVPGSWPAQATTRAPVRLREALDRAPGVRLVLLRPVGRATTPVGLVLAGTVPGRTWLREVAEADVADVVAALVEEPVVAQLVTGRDPGLGRLVDRPAVLVCTNGARDACCAREGRAAAVAVQARLGATRARLIGRSRPRAEVWESSHLGGHRFAPTAAVLPHGMVLGGLGPEPEPLLDAVDDLLDGRAVLEGYRGRSTYRPPEQAAESAVRRHLAVLGVNAWADDVRVDGSEALDDHGTRRVFVRHTGGRTFRVLVRQVETGLSRPVSCGAGATLVLVWETEVDADPAPGVYLGA